MPSTTVSQSRIGLFQPTRRPKYKSDYRVRTKWGWVLVNGKLGQKHSDVLEALLFCAENKATIKDGRIKILVDPYQVRIYAKISSSAEVNSIIQDLLSAVVSVEFKSKNGGTCKSKGHLIDYICDATRANGEPITRNNPIDRKPRSLWRVELGKALCDIIANDHWITEDPRPIAEINSGICQAIARHIFSHKNQPNGGWILRNLIILLIGSEAPKQQLYDRTREVNHGIEALRAVGIIVKQGRLLVNKDRKKLILEHNSEPLEHNSELLEQNSDIWSKTPDSAVL